MMTSAGTQKIGRLVKLMLHLFPLRVEGNLTRDVCNKNIYNDGGLH